MLLNVELENDKRERDAKRRKNCKHDEDPVASDFHRTMMLTSRTPLDRYSAAKISLNKEQVQAAVMTVEQWSHSQVRRKPLVEQRNRWKFSSDVDWSNGWFRCVIRFSWTCCGLFFSRRCIAIISTPWNVDIQIIISNGSARRTVAPWKWEENRDERRETFICARLAILSQFRSGRKFLSECNERFTWITRCGRRRCACRSSAANLPIVYGAVCSSTFHRPFCSS